jgi:hypothetical protein
MTVQSVGNSRATSSVTAANTSSGGALRATSVATRRNAACSSASPRTPVPVNGALHPISRHAQIVCRDTTTAHHAQRRSPRPYEERPSAAAPPTARARALTRKPTPALSLRDIPDVSRESPASQQRPKPPPPTSSGLSPNVSEPRSPRWTAAHIWSCASARSRHRAHPRRAQRDHPTSSLAMHT